MMKDQLVRRGILHSPHGLPRVLCFRVEEDLSHLFFNYGVAKVFWKKVSQWIGKQWVNKDIVWKSFSCWTSVEKFNMFKIGNI